MTKEDFIRRFKMYADSNYVLPSVAPGELVTPMPWNNYALMTEEDLGAIYEHLKSIPPIQKERQKFKLN